MCIKNCSTVGLTEIAKDFVEKCASGRQIARLSKWRSLGSSKTSGV